MTYPRIDIPIEGSSSCRVMTHTDVFTYELQHLNISETSTSSCCSSIYTGSSRKSRIICICPPEVGTLFRGTAEIYQVEFWSRSCEDYRSVTIIFVIFIAYYPSSTILISEPYSRRSIEICISIVVSVLKCVLSVSLVCS